jgi:ABC-type multidrug transport system fused ATPase/permease subunit
MTDETIKEVDHDSLERIYVNMAISKAIMRIVEADKGVMVGFVVLFLLLFGIFVSVRNELILVFLVLGLINSLLMLFLLEVGRRSIKTAKDTIEELSKRKG